MPVTELTKFKVLDTCPEGFMTSKELHEGFNILRKHTGHTVHMLQSGTDVFLIESWDKIDNHETFQGTQDHEDTIQLIAGKMDVEWIRHMEIDLKSTPFLSDPKFRGEVTIVEVPADVKTEVKDGYATATVLPWPKFELKDEMGYLIDWSKDQSHSKEVKAKSPNLWTAKVTKI